MDGIHDMGGMHGFGKVEPELNEPVFHAAWEGGSPQFWPKARAVPVAPDPNAFHVLARRDGQAAGVEPLRLGQWMAISGASFSTGAGRATSLVRSLFFGALNVRLGYWWNSGIDAGARPGRFPPGLWRRLKALPALLFHMQATLLDEWRGYFPGPSQRFWYLSDGGHFDNTALYEMLRRRLPFVIAIDGGQDPDYLLEDLSILTRAARIDFGADFRWVDPRIARQSGLAGWRAIEKAAGEELPASVKAMVDADSVFELGALQRASHGGAALARIDYRDERARNVTWLLMVKGSAGGDLPVDVRNYAAVHADFPNESTLNQFFSDSQWESYRMLGYWLGRKLF